MMFWNRRENGPLGLIAGNGVFPLIFAEAATLAGRTVSAIGLKGQTNPALENLVQNIDYIELGEVGKLVEILKARKIRQAVLAGGVPKREMYNRNFHMDEAAKGLIAGAKNRGDDHLLKALRVYLKLRCGVDIIDSRRILKNSAATKGVMTRRAPTKEEWEDMRFGYKIAKSVGRLDIGQTVVVRQKVVLAVEAIEGTDAAIARGGTLGHGEAVVVKTAKPKQDLRFDLPCVGPDTIESLKKYHSRVLGMEAGKTIMLKKTEIIEAADKAGITLVGL